MLVYQGYTNTYNKATGNIILTLAPPLRETVQQIQTKDLGIRKISSKMVPQILTLMKKQCQLHVLPDLYNNAEIFNRIITNNEMWHVQYKQERIHHKMQ